MAFKPDSLTNEYKSAPLNPSHLSELANCFKSTSASSGIFLVNAFKIINLSPASGSGTYNYLSNLPPSQQCRVQYIPAYL